MEREAMKTLVHWKEKARRKPMLITGCRQCGKTWLMTAFGERYFERTVLFNFEREPGIADIFKYDLNPERILHELGMYRDGKPIDPEHTLIIFESYAPWVGESLKPNSSRLAFSLLAFR